MFIAHWQLENGYATIKTVDIAVYKIMTGTLVAISYNLWLTGYH